MYKSLFKELKLCNKLLEDLEAIKHLCNITNEDHKNFLNRREKLIKCEELHEYLLINCFSLADLLLSVEQKILRLNNTEELYPINNETTLSSLNPLWETHILVEKQDCSKIVSVVDALISKVTVWKTFLDDEEDRGSSSSYSDYSGSETDTTQDDDDYQQSSGS